MKLPLPIVLGWTAVFAASVYFYMKPQRVEQHGNYIAKLHKSSGDVEFREPYFATWRNAQPGQPFKAGSSFSTGEKSTAILEMSDGSMLSVSANSQLVLGATNSSQEGMLVSIASGSLSVAKKVSEEKSFLGFIKKVVPQSKGAVASLQKLVGQSEPAMKIQSGKVQLQVDSDAGSISVARSGGLLSVQSEGETKAVGGSGFTANLTPERVVVLRDEDTGAAPVISQEVREVQVAQGLLANLSDELLALKKVQAEKEAHEAAQAEAAKNNPSAALQPTATPMPTPMATPIPTPKPILVPFDAGDWALASHNSGSLLISTRDHMSKTHAPLDLNFQYRKKWPVGALPLVAPTLEMRFVGGKRTLEFRPLRNDNTNIWYRISAQQLAGALALAKGNLTAQLHLKERNAAQESGNDAANGIAKPVATIQMVSVGDLPESPYVLRLPRLKWQNGARDFWQKSVKLLGDGEKKARGVALYLPSRGVLQQVMEAVTLSEGMSLEFFSNSDVKAEVFANDKGVQAAVWGAVTWNQALYSQFSKIVPHDFIYRGAISSFLASQELTAFLESKTNSQSAQKLYFKTQGAQIEIPRKILDSHAGLAKFMQSISQKLVFRSQVEMVADNKDMSGDSTYARQLKSPENFGRPTKYPRGNIALVMISEPKNRVSFPDFKVLGIEDSGMFKVQESEMLQVNMMVNKLNTQSLVQDSHKEQDFLKSISSMSEVDLLLVLRKSKDGTLNKSMLGYATSHEVVVTRELGMKKGTELAKWMRSRIASDGVVSLVRDGWARVEVDLGSPKVGQVGVVLDAPPKVWMTKFEAQNPVRLMVVCRVLERGACISRVHSQSGSDLLEAGAKIHWIATD